MPTIVSVVVIRRPLCEGLNWALCNLHLPFHKTGISLVLGDFPHIQILYHELKINTIAIFLTSFCECIIIIRIHFFILSVTSFCQTMASGIEPSIKELVACKPKSFAYFMWSA